MQGVHIPDFKQQEDDSAGTNGGVHFVIQYPQAAVVPVHSGRHKQVSHSQLMFSYVNLFKTYYLPILNPVGFVSKII